MENDEKDKKELEFDFSQTLEKIKEDALKRRDLIIFMTGVLAGAIPTTNN